MDDRPQSYPPAELLEPLRWSLSSMTREARTMCDEAQQSIKAARQMRKDLIPVLEWMAEDDPDFLRRYHLSMLTAVVDAAMRITGADMGNIQLFDPASTALHIEAQRGFSQPFLEFFDCVHDGQAACGTACRTRGRVIVEDVAESAIFLGTPALEVLLDAGVRAVQSTPLICRSGFILGVISTHWRSPRRPSNRDLFPLDLLARNAAEWVEQRMTPRLSFAPAPNCTRQGAPGRP